MGSKIRKISSGGTPEKRKKHKIKKRGGPLNSVVVLGAILKKNGVPRWTQKSIKIYKKKKVQNGCKFNIK